MPHETGAIIVLFIWNLTLAVKSFQFDYSNGPTDYNLNTLSFCMVAFAIESL